MVIKIAAKTGIAGGIIYYLSDLGIWGNSHQAEHIMNNVKAYAHPHVNKLQKSLSIDIPSLPERGEMVPCYLGRLAKTTKDAISKTLNEPKVKN